jgi:hypothetical protein
MLPHIKVTAHPSSPSVIGFFVLIAYRSITFDTVVFQPHFITQRDAKGDFVESFLSGDMASIAISALETFPGAIVYAQ